ncbi:MAG: SO_0444 family Cu/Zn efflux transporter [Planctomycetota bacterium]|jgi:hypothetical protein|nr:SO_0444 family Cu/Zn efflux transporter [Planctomycetota bacterium]MDP6990745.1 SO_0444 family Cu/Zn efflux transporter [Planctomycetota bacterium]
MDPTPLEITLALFAASLGGALLPLARRWSDSGLHLFAAVSAGIFLGTVFLHLQPELAEHGGDHASAPWLAALGGFLGLFLLEKVWLRGSGADLEADGHTVLWLSLLVGLSVHAFAAGVALSALLGAPAGAGVLLLPILWHKMTESFSLATVMKLAGVGNGRGLAVQLLFAAVTPAGLLLGAGIAGGATSQPVLLGFASGTFLYVAVCDLLPEVFHDLDRPRDRVLGLLAGVVAVAALPHHADGDGAFVGTFLSSSLDVFIAMAPYLLGGFFVAGLISQLLSPAWLARHLSGNDLSSVGIASVVGAPLPLCSCSVIPVAVALRRSGASKGSTSAFLISTPETGIDSVSVTWALLDPLMTLVRPLAAVGSALFTGMTVSLFANSRHDDVPRAGLEDEGGGGSCCKKAAALTAPVAERPPADGNLLVRALRYAFVDMLDDLAGALVAGILLSGLMAAVIPDAWFDGAFFSGASGLFVMLLIGVPIYVCAAASTPLAAAMVLKGLSPGAAIVFLLAGPATNMATLTVMARTLGARVVAVHIAALAGVTLTMGLAVDWLYRTLGRELVARAGEHHAAHGGILGPACAVVFGLLLATAFWRTHSGPRASASVDPDGGGALRTP